MRKLRILGRSIRDSVRSVFRNFSLSFASVSCITITLIVVAFFLLMSNNVKRFTKLIEEDVTIVAFLDLDITVEEIENLTSDIKDLSNVDCGEETYNDACPNIKYVDKMDISAEMMAANPDLENVMKDYTRENSPIQSTIQVKVNDIEKIESTAKQIEQMENVESVNYGAEMVGSLVPTFDFVKKTCLIVVIALVVVTAVLISNTIKITIFSRRREIEIMRLVGASNSHIKIPFVFEGLILGALGSVLPIIITIYGYKFIYSKMNGVLFSNLFKLLNPYPMVYMVSLVLLAIGMIVGMIGSYKAVKKYLKI